MVVGLIGTDTQAEEKFTRNIKELVLDAEHIIQKRSIREYHSGKLGGN